MFLLKNSSGNVELGRWINFMASSQQIFSFPAALLKMTRKTFSWFCSLWKKIARKNGFMINKCYKVQKSSKLLSHRCRGNQCIKQTFLFSFLQFSKTSTHTNDVCKEQLPCYLINFMKLLLVNFH